jgi:hypothetical protein
LTSVHFETLSETQSIQKPAAVIGGKLVPLFNRSEPARASVTVFELLTVRASSYILKIQPFGNEAAAGIMYTRDAVKVALIFAFAVLIEAFASPRFPIPVGQKEETVALGVEPLTLKAVGSTVSRVVPEIGVIVSVTVTDPPPPPAPQSEPVPEIVPRLLVCRHWVEPVTSARVSPVTLGLTLKTTSPVPLLVVREARRFAELGAPRKVPTLEARPEMPAIGNPVALTRFAALGVPRFGVVRAGDTLKTTRPVPVFVVNSERRFALLGAEIHCETPAAGVNAPGALLLLTWISPFTPATLPLPPPVAQVTVWLALIDRMKLFRPQSVTAIELIVLL